jgi:hypothetical protein
MRLFGGRHGRLPCLLGRRPHRWRGGRTTRDTRRSPLLNAGVPATEVARRAGRGVAVMLKVHADCVDGDEPIVNARIEDALRSGHGTPDVAPGQRGRGQACDTYATRRIE